MNEPISIFTNDDELQKCLEYWKEKLLLQNWRIVCELVPSEDIEGDYARNKVNVVMNASYIRIAIFDKKMVEFNDDIRYKLRNFCHEQTLVHELLHCHYNNIGWNNSSYELILADRLEHERLEQLSKTLIMVKYNLPIDWFTKC